MFRPILFLANIRLDTIIGENYTIQGYSKLLSEFLQLVIHNKLETGIYVLFYLIEKHSKFSLHTLQVLYMCTICDSTNIDRIIYFVPNYL